MSAPLSPDVLSIDVQASSDYIKGQKALETLPSEFKGPESIKASRQTEISAVTPYFTPEMDQLLEAGKSGSSWAQFFSPPGIDLAGRNIFTSTIVPSINMFEVIEKLNMLSTNESKQKTKIMEMVNVIDKLNQISIETKNKRDQYQKP